jgi:outer membrane protein assembly factor BamE (lipoprotein component of BamABCDE complex)
MRRDKRKGSDGQALAKAGGPMTAGDGMSKNGAVRRGWRAAALALALGGAVACTPLYRNHGYIPLDEDLNAIVIGQDTRETVLETFGSPTAGGVMNDEGFYYVRSRFRHYGPLEPQEIDRQVLAVSFAPSGVVQNIERFGLEDGQVVTLSRRVTDDNIRDTTFIRQLLGNLGNFDASQIIGNE